jgi:ankyrin repeat protein
MQSKVNHLGGLYGIPLHASVLGGHIEVSQFLHRAWCRHQFTLCRQHLEVARILLERNVDVDSRDDHGCTPFLCASANGHPDIVQVIPGLQCGCALRGQHRKHSTAQGSRNGHLEISRILLERNVEVNSQDDHGCTPLLIATENGHRDVARLLLDHNADVRVATTNGNTPLHFAASMDTSKFARILLERNAEVDSRNNHGLTPLCQSMEMDT